MNNYEIIYTLLLILIAWSVILTVMVRHKLKKCGERNQVLENRIRISDSEHTVVTKATLNQKIL